MRNLILLSFELVCNLNKIYLNSSGDAAAGLLVMSLLVQDTRGIAASLNLQIKKFNLAKKSIVV